MLAMTMEIEKGGSDFEQPQSLIVFEGGIPLLRDAVLIQEVEAIKAEHKRLQQLERFHEETVAKMTDPNTVVHSYYSDLQRDYAACRGRGNSKFFPEQRKTAKAAKEICKGCIMQPACLEYALVTNEKHGVWGGATERERRKIRRQRALEKSVKD
jgi:WhiB family redox-sensing transcriptional regulator